jgi:hypothetical protein
MVSSYIQATGAHTRVMQNRFSAKREGFSQKAAEPGSNSSRLCVFFSAQLPWHVEPSILHKEGHEMQRYAHCNDPLDTAANLRRKSSKDLLLCAIKS